MSDALDARIEAGIAVLSAVVFIAFLVYAGVATTDFGATGAYVVVGGIVGFILFMAAIGYWISTKESTEPEDADGAESGEEDN